MASKINELRTLGWSIKDIAELASELNKVYSEVQELETEMQLKHTKKPTREESVSNLLKEMGCRFSFLGYSYLREAIMYCLEKERVVPITKELYPHVAKKFETTSPRVERAIRHAIEYMVKRNQSYSKTIFTEVFGNSVRFNESITNTHFIASCVDYLQLHQD